MTVGDCFYFPTPPQEDHLFVVIAPALDAADEFLCVNITTKRGGREGTCEISRGEHSELKEETSVVAYGWARQLPRSLIEKNIARQKLRPFSEDLVKRIQRNALSPSSRLPKKFQATIRQYMR